ncbi:uncharacterized protein PGTG_22162 [Puccinia graminis f. sp. tritici CRL 75-36-700-3]|uniref:Uncharacterized protein n=1 Tax=Puccinia graminis f. sp. tritici (strain CRL 75-36-700-3 / race SCCL) TaxID=418459 RepID=H6QTN0_PUCGT|nr:uncharacterized protein PGTG_22162 [Puccinia graminis f. sp. tritici CRL 75-36-700-3]EHS64245.1 hypothetical protein PGTG_22162 [Puccinia graminis f. sp. tritici CRL 75-36-700-3]
MPAPIECEISAGQARPRKRERARSEDPLKPGLCRTFFLFHPSQLLSPASPAHHGTMGSQKIRMGHSNRFWYKAGPLLAVSVSTIFPPAPPHRKLE